MRSHNMILMTLLLAGLLVSASFAGEQPSAPRWAWSEISASAGAPLAPMDPHAAYTGELRVYMVEPFSRHRDGSNHIYEFGFLDYSLIMDINVADGETFDTTIIWDAESAGFGNITQYNIQATAAIFNPNGVTKDAYPNDGNWFSAHYVDAAAGAKAGKIGRNYMGDDFTHTVFVEEGTATW